MSQTRQTQRPTCNECGSDLRLIGINDIGRPVWECRGGHQQVGPFV